MTQSQALKIMKTGLNVFLTGSAGSGKTFVLNQYIKYLKEHSVNVAITASTGIASTHMNGMTIHSWSGIGVKDTISNYDLENMESKKYLWSRFDSVKVLIIDEVSMLHSFRLDMVDKVLKRFKRNDKPFGGIQVILSGDLFQLPPVNKNKEASFDDFIVNSDSFLNGKFAICYLSGQHRQEDESFSEILNAIRDDVLGESHLNILKSRLSVSFDAHIFPTKLYTHNVNVDKENDFHLEKIKEAFKTYKMESVGNDFLVEILKKSILAKEDLKLKKGAEVMFIKNNFELGYVNGTKGTVVDFNSFDLPIVKLQNGKLINVSPESWSIEENGKVKASVSQIPLRLAWAITIHKSQGMSLDVAEIDLSNTFSFGMGYVALSRLRKISGLRLLGFDIKALDINKDVLSFDKKLKKESKENVDLFGKLAKEEQQKLEENFILKSDGTLVKSKEVDTKTNKVKKIPTILLTKELLEQKMDIISIAKKRNLSFNTILGHIEEIVKKDKDIDLFFLKVDKKHIEMVKKANEKIIKRGKAEELGKLTPLKIEIEKMGKDLSFDEIRIARLFL